MRSVERGRELKLQFSSLRLGNQITTPREANYAWNSILDLWFVHCKLRLPSTQRISCQRPKRGRGFLERFPRLSRNEIRYELFSAAVAISFASRFTILKIGGRVRA